MTQILDQQVQQGDPDRYLATSLVQEPLKSSLLTLYAFNLEIARAPWTSAETMIAEMRLQWWLDSIGDIFEGRGPRGHQVLEPLAALIKKHDLPRKLFDEMINARQFDIYKEPHADRVAFDQYIHATSSNIMELSALVLGASDVEIVKVRQVGYAMGVANLLRAAPELTARGRVVLPENVTGLVADALGMAVARYDVSAAVRPAVLAGWRAVATLKTAQKSPESIQAGLLEESPAWRRVSFWWARRFRR
ncbi:MAG: squalene/phytoene synthase family protein [Rhodobacteraceae bacterium]|nr:squalene/phytoene synthase family protein [Paracoccaceae bacterium]